MLVCAVRVRNKLFGSPAGLHIIYF